MIFMHLSDSDLPLPLGDTISQHQSEAGLQSLLSVWVSLDVKVLACSYATEYRGIIDSGASPVQTLTNKMSKM